MDSTLTVTAAAPHGLITAAELADHIGSPGLQSFAIVNAAKAASALVDSYCGTEFGLQTYQEVFRDRPAFRGNHLDINLGRQHVISPITSVVDAASVTVDAADYELIDARAGKMRFYESAPFTLDSNRWRLTITYQAGFATAPDDLKRAALEIGQRLFRTAGTTEGVVTQESIGDWSATYPQAFVSGPVRGILGRYRVLNLP